MSALLNFLQHTDLTSDKVFARELSEVADGATATKLDTRVVQRLMMVSHGARHSPAVLVLLSYLTRHAHERGDAGCLVRVCRLLFPLRVQCKAAGALYRVALESLPAVVPPVCAFGTRCGGHAIARGVASANPLFDSVLQLLARQVSGTAEPANVRANMQSAVVCLHKCMVTVDGRIHLIDESKVLPTMLARDLIEGLVDKYHLLTQDHNVEYITIGVLECLCGYGFHDRVFRHLVMRFCDCLSEGNMLMCLFLHHTLLRLLAQPALMTHIGASIIMYRDIDYVLARVYAAPAVRGSMHIAAACVVSEMLETARQIDTDEFARVEQLVDVVLHSGARDLRENYVFLLARAVLFLQGRLDDATADRVLATLAEVWHKPFAVDSRTHPHIAAAIHHLLVRRRYNASAHSWHQVGLGASRAVNTLAANTPLTTLSILLFACRRMHYAHMAAVVQGTTMLAGVLRDADFVSRAPSGVTFVMRILRVFVQRTGAIQAPAMRRAVLALDLQPAVAALSEICLAHGIGNNYASRGMLVYLARSLHFFLQYRVFQASDMQRQGLRLLAHNLRLVSSRNSQNILSTHKVMHLFLDQIPQLSALSDPALVAELIGAAARPGVTALTPVRVSTLKLLCALHAKNDGLCACALGVQHAAQCHAVIHYSARALGRGDPEDARRRCDVKTYLSAQEILLAATRTPLHMPSVLAPGPRQRLTALIAKGLADSHRSLPPEMASSALAARDALIVAGLGAL